MTNVAQITTDISRAIADAIGELVRVRHWDHSSDVTLPIFYPSGSAVSLCIEKVKHGYAISDNGLAYRELEQIGGETFFSKNASGIIEGGNGVWHNTREILSEATPETLASAMADVAAASSRLTWNVLSKLSRKGQVEIADYLFERLRIIFGDARVERDRRIIGPSTREWRIDAVVHLEGNESIFQAVANTHLSVYPTAAMFHDLALIESPPTTISVVKSKDAMGSLFNILAQAGNVIEEAQTDQVYEKAVQWHI